MEGGERETSVNRLHAWKANAGKRISLLTVPAADSIMENGGMHNSQFKSLNGKLKRSAEIKTHNTLANGKRLTK